MGVLFGTLAVWLAAGVVFALAFKLLGLRYVVRRVPDDDQLFLPGLGPEYRRPQAPFRYARHARPTSLRSRRQSSLPSHSL